MSQLQSKISQNFNQGVFTKNQLSQNSYYVNSGFGQGTIDRINFEVQQKFPDRTFPPLMQKISENDFISFAYLFKKFQFQEPFNQLHNFYFKGNSVPGFRALKSKQKMQLYYKYYKNSQDFMIGIKTQTPNDEIMLWKTNQTGLNDMKFQKVLKILEFYNQLQSQPLGRIDQFAMPVIEIEYNRIYKQLLGLNFANQGFQKFLVQKMIQKMKLLVTRTGITFEDQAQIMVPTSSPISQDEPKYFYLNSDFWLIMKQKNKRPYMIMLVKETKENQNI